MGAGHKDSLACHKIEYTVTNEEQALRAENMSNRQVLGTFGTSDPNEHHGDLTIAGRDTAIRLIGPDLASISDAEVIYGHTTHGKVTCIDCISTSALRTFNGSSWIEQAKIFPHYVVHGPVFFDSKEASITKVTFRFSDIDVMFGGSGSIGSFTTSRELMESILNDSRKGEEANVGEMPVVSYYSGQAQVWSLQTAMGKISVRDVINFDALHPFAHHLEMEIAFESRVDLKKAVENLQRVRHCLVAVVGRAQALDAIKITLDGSAIPEKTRPLQLKLEWCLSPEGPTDSESAPGSSALPLHPLRRPSECSSVIAGWFAREEAWYWPRARYVEGIERGRYYSSDRLVAAANMFDLLPDSAYAPPEPLEQSVVEAAAQAKAIFQDLPNSIERSIVLGALGRIKKLSLPKKVMQRGEIVLSQFGPRLPSLQKVLKAAIQCRNHLVHDSEFDMDAVDDYFSLMTDALEFVFVASDLIELGWQAADWATSQGGSGHRFAEFMHMYSASIKGFVEAYDG